MTSRSHLTTPFLGVFWGWFGFGWREGPAARTREESTRPAGQQVTGGSDRQRGFTAKRRGPTHVRARVGRIVVGLLEQVYRERRGDG